MIKKRWKSKKTRANFLKKPWLSQKLFSKKCRAKIKQVRLWQEKNPVKIAATRKKWYGANKPKIKEYYQNNKKKWHLKEVKILREFKKLKRSFLEQEKEIKI